MKNDITALSVPELEALAAELRKQYDGYKSRGLKLDMSRGKPCTAQLDLSEKMLTVLSDNASCVDATGFDCRNYGVMDGIAEAKQMFAQLFGVEADEVIVGGNSSLNMMYDQIVRGLLLGVYGGEKPWSAQGKIRFICPVPGYDRHFSICESLGIEMVNVALTPNGPDMDAVEKLIKDPSVKGMWNIPKYSNPTGITYSDETVRRIARMKPAAKDFRVFWDNAYALHDFGPNPDTLLDLMAEAKKAGNEDMILMYMSTSKISFPGAGVAAMAASKANIDLIKKQMFFQTIGPDKLNQLRHVRYFGSADGLKAYMKKHAAIIKPHFDVALSTLDRELKGTGAADWYAPNGGYFISFNVLPGCAKKVVAMMKDAGVTVTGAGSAFPYGKDPDDKNIRLAPTYPSLEELQTAMDILCVCTKLAAAEKLLGL